MSALLSSLREHVVTRELQEALHDFHPALQKAGHSETGRSVAQATGLLAQGASRLNSRSTRVPQPSGA